MRKTTIQDETGSYEITYPEYIVFSHNYNSIKIKTIVNHEYNSWFKISIGEHTIKAYSHSDEIDVNINSLLKVLDLSVPNNRYCVTELFFETQNGSEEKVGDMFVVFGALLFGQRFFIQGTFNSDKKQLDRHITWFTNYPMKFSAYVNEEYTITETQGNNVVRKEDVPTSQIYDFNYEISPEQRDNRLIKIFDQYEGRNNPFSEEFSEEFGSISPYSTYIHLEPCSKKDGIFLRWIDNKGMWYSYLFESGEYETQSEQSSDSIVSSQVSNGIQYAMNIPISVVNKRTITCCATRLDEERFDDVSSVINALYVEMYIGGDFKRVSLNTKSIKKKSKNALNDVEIEVLIDSTTYSI